MTFVEEIRQVTAAFLASLDAMARYKEKPGKRTQANANLMGSNYRKHYNALSNYQVRLFTLQIRPWLED